MTLIEFQLPGLPPTTNAMNAMHLQVRLKSKRTWRDSSKWSAIKAKQGVVGNPFPLKHGHVTFIRYSSVEPDFDGLVSSCKHILDGLVEAGVLVGDKVSQVTGVYKWQKVSPGKGCVVVRVELPKAAE